MPGRGAQVFERDAGEAVLGEERGGRGEQGRAAVGLGPTAGRRRHILRHGAPSRRSVARIAATIARQSS